MIERKSMDSEKRGPCSHRCLWQIEQNALAFFSLT
jgi:hypothetical protein